MKAAIYHGPGDMRIEEIERPKAGEEGLVMKVRAAGICGSDLRYYKQYVPIVTRGLAIGHENAGDVVEVGANVKDVTVGDRVFAVGFLPCFECEWCKNREFFKCTNRKGATGYGLHGGFAEYMWVPAVVLNENVFKLTETMSYQDGALMEPTAVGARVVNRVAPKTDDVAVVLGAGMVGLGALATLKALGVSKLIVSDISDKRLQAAKELGANLTINAAEEDATKRVMEETSGGGADVVIEAAGQSVTFLQSIDMVRLEGKIGLVAAHDDSFEFSPYPFLRKRATLIGSMGNDFQTGFDIVKAGGVKDKQVVSHAFPLDSIKEAIETALNTKASIKVMIEP